MSRAVTLYAIALLASAFAATPDPVSPDPETPRPIEAVDTVFIEDMTLGLHKIRRRDAHCCWFFCGFCSSEWCRLSSRFVNCGNTSW